MAIKFLKITLLVLAMIYISFWGFVSFYVSSSISEKYQEPGVAFKISSALWDFFPHPDLDYNARVFSWMSYINGPGIFEMHRAEYTNFLIRDSGRLSAFLSRQTGQSPLSEKTVGIIFAQVSRHLNLIRFLEGVDSIPLTNSINSAVSSANNRNFAPMFDFYLEAFLYYSIVNDDRAGKIKALIDEKSTRLNDQQRILVRYYALIAGCMTGGNVADGESSVESNAEEPFAGVREYMAYTMIYIYSIEASKKSSLCRLKVNKFLGEMA